MEEGFEEVLKTTIDDYLKMKEMTKRGFTEFDRKEEQIYQERAKINWDKSNIKDSMEQAGIVKGEDTKTIQDLEELDKKLADLDKREEDISKGRRQVQKEENDKFEPKLSKLVEIVLREESSGWCQRRAKKEKRRLKCGNCDKEPSDPQALKEICGEGLVECLECIEKEPRCDCCGQEKEREEWKEGLDILDTITFFQMLAERVKSWFLSRNGRKP